MRPLIYIVILGLTGVSCGRLGFELTDAGAGPKTDAPWDGRTEMESGIGNGEDAFGPPDAPLDGGDLGCATPVAIVDIESTAYCGPCNTNVDMRAASAVVPAGSYLLIPVSGAFSLSDERDNTWVWRVCAAYGDPRQSPYFEAPDGPFMSAEAALATAQSVRHLLNVAQDNTRISFWVRDAICSDNVGRLRVAICPR